MAALKNLVLHCTATREGREVTADDIHKWHLGALKNKDGSYTFLGKKYTAGQLAKQTLVLPSGKRIPANQTNGRGWRQVGYTDLIHLDGQVERLVDNNEDANVDPWETTNGATGINSVSRHVVYVGGVDAFGKAKDTRTPEQLKAMEEYVRDFNRRFPTVNIDGHNRWAAKACPSFDVKKWLKTIGINK